MAAHYQDIAKWFDTSRIPLDFARTAFDIAQSPFEEAIQAIEAAILRADTRCDFSTRIEGFHYTPLLNILSDHLDIVISDYTKLSKKENPDKEAILALESKLKQIVSLLYRIYCTVWSFEGVKIHNSFTYIFRFCGNPTILELLHDMAYYLFIARDWNKTDLHATKYLLAFGTPFLKLLNSFQWNYLNLNSFLTDKIQALSRSEIVTLFSQFTNLGEDLIKVIQEAPEGAVFMPEAVLAKIRPDLVENKENEKLTSYYEYLGAVALGILLLREERAQSRKFYSFLAIIQSSTGLLLRLTDNKKFHSMAGNIENLEFYSQVPLVLSPTYIQILFDEFNDFKAIIDQQNENKEGTPTLPEQEKLGKMRRIYRLIDGVSNSSVILAAMFSEKSFTNFKETAAKYLCEQEATGSSGFYQMLRFTLDEYLKCTNDSKWTKARHVHILDQDYRDVLLEALNSLIIGFTEFLNRLIERGRANRIGIIELPDRFGTIFRKTMDLITEILATRDFLKEDYCEPLFVVFRFLNLRTQGMQHYHMAVYNKFEEILSIPFSEAFQVSMKQFTKTYSNGEGNHQEIEVNSIATGTTEPIRKELVQKYVRVVHKLFEQVMKVCKQGQWDNSPYVEIFDRMVTSKLWNLIIDKSYEEEAWKTQTENWSQEQIEAAQNSGYRLCLALMTLQMNAQEGGIQFFVEETFKKVSEAVLRFSMGNKYKTLHGFQVLLETFERLDYEFPLVDVGRKLVVYVYKECLTDVETSDEALESISTELLGSEMVNLFTNSNKEYDAVDFSKTWLRQVYQSLSRVEKFLDEKFNKLNHYLKALDLEAEAYRDKRLDRIEGRRTNTIHEDEVEEALFVSTESISDPEKKNLIEHKRQKLEEYFLMVMYSKLAHLNQVLEMMAGCLTFEQIGVDSETLESIQGLLRLRWINYCCNYFKMNYVYIFWDFYSDCLSRSGIKGGGSEMYRVMTIAYRALEEEALKGNTRGMLNCLKSLPSEETEKILHTREKFMLNSYGGFRTGLFAVIFVVKTIEVMSELFLNARWYTQTQDISIIDNLEHIFNWALTSYTNCLKEINGQKSIQTSLGRELWSEYDPIFQALLRNGVLEAASSDSVAVEKFIKCLTNIIAQYRGKNGTNLSIEKEENAENWSEWELKGTEEIFRMKWVFNILKKSLDRGSQKNIMHEFFNLKGDANDNNHSNFAQAFEWFDQTVAFLEKADKPKLEVLKEYATGALLKILEALDSYFGYHAELNTEDFSQVQTYYSFLLELIIKVNRFVDTKQWAVSLWVQSVKSYRKMLEKVCEYKNEGAQDFLSFKEKLKADLQMNLNFFMENTELFYRLFLFGEKSMQSNLEKLVDNEAFSTFRKKFPSLLLQKALEITKKTGNSAQIGGFISNFGVHNAKYDKQGQEIFIMLKLQRFGHNLLPANEQADNQENTENLEERKIIDELQEVGLQYLFSLDFDESFGKSQNEDNIKVYLKFAGYLLGLKNIQTNATAPSKTFWDALTKHAARCLEFSERVVKKKSDCPEELFEAVRSIYVVILRTTMNNEEAFIAFSTQRELIKGIIRLGCKLRKAEDWLKSVLAVYALNGCSLPEWYECSLSSYYKKELRGVAVNQSNSAFKDPVISFLQDRAIKEVEGLLGQWENTPDEGGDYTDVQPPKTKEQKLKYPSTLVSQGLSSTLEGVLEALGEAILEDLNTRLKNFAGEDVAIGNLEEPVKLATWLISTFPYISSRLFQIKVDCSRFSLTCEFTNRQNLSLGEILVRIIALVSPLNTKQLLTTLCETPSPFINVPFKQNSMLIASHQDTNVSIELGNWTVNTLLQGFRTDLAHLIQGTNSIQTSFRTSWQWYCWSKIVLLPIVKSQVEVLEHITEDVISKCLHFTSKFLGNRQINVCWEGFQVFFCEFFLVMLRRLFSKWTGALGTGKKAGPKPQVLYYLLVLLKKRHRRSHSLKAISQSETLSRHTTPGKISIEKRNMMEIEEIDIKYQQQVVYKNIGLPFTDGDIEQVYRGVMKSAHPEDTFETHVVTKICNDLEGLVDFFVDKEKKNFESNTIHWKKNFRKIYEAQVHEAPIIPSNHSKEHKGEQKLEFEEDITKAWNITTTKNHQETKLFENVTKTLKKSAREDIKEKVVTPGEEIDVKEIEKIKKIIEDRGASLKKEMQEKLESLHIQTIFESENGMTDSNGSTEAIRKGFIWYNSLDLLEQKAVACVDSVGLLKEILPEETYTIAKNFKSYYERQLARLENKEELVIDRSHRHVSSGEFDFLDADRGSEDEYETVGEDAELEEIPLDDPGQNEPPADEADFEYETCRSFRTNSVISTEDIPDLLNENEEEAADFIEDKKKDLEGQYSTIVQNLPQLQPDVLHSVLEFWGRVFPCWDLIHNVGENRLILDTILYLKTLGCDDRNEQLILDTFTTILVSKPESLNLDLEGPESYRRLSIGIITFLNIYFRDFPESVCLAKSSKPYNSDLLHQGGCTSDTDYSKMSVITRILERIYTEGSQGNDYLLFKKLVDLFVVIMRGSWQKRLTLELSGSKNITERIISLIKSPVLIKNRKLLTRFCSGLRYFVWINKEAVNLEHIVLEAVDNILGGSLEAFDKRIPEIQQFFKMEEVTADNYEVLRELLDCNIISIVEVLSILEAYLQHREIKTLVSAILERLEKVGIIVKVCEIVNLWPYLRAKNAKDWHIIQEIMLKYFELALYLYSFMDIQAGSGRRMRELNKAAYRSWSRKDGKNMSPDQEHEEYGLRKMSDVSVEDNDHQSGVQRKYSRSYEDLHRNNNKHQEDTKMIIEGEKGNETPKEKEIIEQMETAIIGNREPISVVIEVDPGIIIQRDDLLKMIGSFPGLIDMDRKRMILRKYLSQHLKTRNLDNDAGFTKVRVRRDRILEDTMNELSNLSGEDLQTWNFTVIFEKEAGIDAGGLTSEWITLILKELFKIEQGLFKLSYNGICLYPSSFSNLIPNNLAYFKLAGQMAALSIREEVLSGIPFTRGFLKQILDKKINLEDLEEIDPQLAKSLLYILRCNPEEVSMLYQSFTYESECLGIKSTKELIPGGSNTMVSEENRGEYVDRLIQAMLVDEVAQQVKEFNKGLYEVLPAGIMKMFLPYELEMLICGQSEIGLDDIKSLVRYTGYSSKDRVIKWLWEVVKDFTDEERTSLLFFITGSSALPPKGFGDIKITIKRYYGQNTSLPIAHTCFNEMELPDYESKEILRQKLLIAITEGKEGFHIV